jgi:hypothetical protein
MSRWRLGFAGMLGGFGILAIVSSALAAEPGNNTLPYSAIGLRSNPQMFGAPNITSSTMTFVGADAITPAGDVDYLLLTCQGLPIQTVGINNFTNDMDIKAYDLSGVLLGSSTSVTPSESIDLAGRNQLGVLLKVYGFQNATSAAYAVWIAC